MEWVRKESEEVGLKMDGKSNGKVSDNSLDLLDICECYVIFSLSVIQTLWDSGYPYQDLYGEGGC